MKDKGFTDIKKDGELTCKSKWHFYMGVVLSSLAGAVAYSVIKTFITELAK